jgi:transcriptional regulator with XRE-family HTH domain
VTTPGQPREPRGRRVRLGGELRRLRMLAGLSGDALGKQLGVSQKTVSRIERGESLPSAPLVTAWLQAVGADDDRSAVVAGLLEAAVNEVATFREMLTGGLAAVQREAGEREAASATVRNFQPGIIPGLLQTADYALRIMEMANIQGAVDLAEAVAVRLARQEALYDKTRRFEFVMTEAALRWRPGPPALLSAALDRVASLATLETVELAVIPADAEMHAITRCGFILYEGRTDGEPDTVAIETPHAQLPVTDPADVALYHDQLALFRESALTGPDAIEFVRAIASPTG